MSEPTRHAQDPDSQDQHTVTDIRDRRSPNGSRWTRPDYSSWVPRLRVVDDTGVSPTLTPVTTPPGEPQFHLPDGHNVVTCLARHRIQRASAKWGIELPPVVA